jgi:glyoxylase I family protein
LEATENDTVTAGNTPSPIRLDHAAVMTTNLERAIAFYTDVLGLSVHVIEPDPIRKGRRRAMLYDAGARDVLEIIEMREMTHAVIPGRGGVHHLGFRLPQRAWHALRARLDTDGIAYREVNNRLFLRDADGLVLEIEPV